MPNSDIGIKPESGKYTNRRDNRYLIFNVLKIYIPREFPSDFAMLSDAKNRRHTRGTAGKRVCKVLIHSALKGIYTFGVKVYIPLG